MQKWHTLHFWSQIDKTCSLSSHHLEEHTFTTEFLPLEMPRLSNEEQNRAIWRLDGGQSVTVVARAFGCSRQTINNLRTRLHQTGSVADRPRPGSQRVTSQREDRYIRLRHLRDRFATATSTSMEFLGWWVNAETIRNRLRTAGLRARRPYFGPVFTRVHRQQRRLWTRRHVRFTQRQWNTVVFSDESRSH